MKAEFDSNRTLVVIAENYTEAYALQKWNEGFIIDDLSDEDSKNRSCLKIDWDIKKEDNKK